MSGLKKKAVEREPASTAPVSMPALLRSARKRETAHPLDDWQTSILAPPDLSRVKHGLPIASLLAYLLQHDAEVQECSAGKGDRVLAVIEEEFTLQFKQPPSLDAQAFHDGLKALLIDALSLGAVPQSAAFAFGDAQHPGQVRVEVVLRPPVQQRRSRDEVGVSTDKGDTRPQLADTARRERLRGLISVGSHDSFESELKALRELTSLTKDEVAARLEPAMGRHLKDLPQDTYEERQSLASWVNGTLRELGLAIRCPKTGKPAILVADRRGGDDESVRMRLEVRAEDGRRIRTFTSNDLPTLRLMQDVPRPEGLARRVGRSR